MVIEIRKQQYRKAGQQAVRGGSAPYKVVVTGFNSFGKNLENPSGLTATGLPSMLEFAGKTVEIEGLLLDTCCKQSWVGVKKALAGSSRARSITSARSSRGSRSKSPTILILMGLAANRDALNLERLALNVRDYPIKDNHGHQYDGEEIQPGPLALETDYPLHGLRKKLISKGFPSIISNHAGTFVCNDLYYQCLAFQEEHGSPDLVLFVHVPKANVFAQSVREHGNKRLTKSLGARPRIAKQLDLLQQSIIEVIKFSVDHLEKQATERPRMRRRSNG
jgi:pyroglutamyl-peptidase